MSMPTRPASQAGNPIKGGEDSDSFGSDSPRLEVRPGSPGPANAGQERASVSNDNNILLDPDILTDHVTQVTKRFLDIGLYIYSEKRECISSSFQPQWWSYQ